MAEQLDRAESSYRSALELREALARENPDNEVYQSKLCEIQNNLGITLQRDGKYEAAEAAHRAALPSWRCWSEIGRRGPIISTTCPTPTTIWALSIS